MANRMEINYNAMMHPGATLKESVDTLRTNIKDLYELDEDNYQLIKTLRSELEKATSRLDKLTRALSVHRAKSFAKLLIFGGVSVYMIREQNRYISRLRERIEVLEAMNNSEDKTEESDG